MQIFSNKKRKEITTIVSLILMVVFLSSSFVFCEKIFNNNDKFEFLGADIENYRKNYLYLGDEKVLSLSIEGGLDSRNNVKIKNILEKHQVPATFFFTGKKVLENKKAVKDLYESGFGIENSSFTGSRDVYNSDRRTRMELNATNAIIENITKQRTVFYRSPNFLYFKDGVIIKTGRRKMPLLIF